MIRKYLYLGCSVACLVIATEWIAGCGRKVSPTAPTNGSSSKVIALTIRGNAALTAPGETSQLMLEATLSDGSKKDVTSTASWSSTNTKVLTVSRSGLATAVDFGKANVFGTSAGDGAAPVLVMKVLPEGTYILSGVISEAVDNLPVADVRVETIGGPMSGRVATTDATGTYAFNGVVGVEQVRATKDNYQPAIQNVTLDTEHVGILLTPAVPFAAIGGVYRLTFTASPSCHLPDDAVSRSYTAKIDEVGGRLSVTLSDAQFGAYFNTPWNMFSGRVLGNTVSFTLNAGYDAIYNGGVAEKLSDGRYLMLSGTAEASITGSTISAAFAGAVSLLSSPNNIWGPSLSCSAADHQLVFTRS